MSTGSRKLAGEMSYLEHARSESAAAYLSCPARWSWMRKLAWVMTDRRLHAQRERTLAALRQKVAAEEEPMERFEMLGPSRPERSHQELQTELAAIWERGSRALRDLCAGAGIPYVHALQPNQYDAAFVKPMGPEERKIALREGGLWARAARSGYPHLRKAAERLAADGIEVLDLKEIFADVEGIRLLDNCCHFNEAGNITIAEALADALLAAGFPRQR